MGDVSNLFNLPKKTQISKVYMNCFRNMYHGDHMLKKILRL